MNALRVIGILLIVGGAASLIFGSFSYTKDKTELKIGPLQVDVKEKQTVNIPVWAGLVGVVGGGLLLLGAKRP